MPEDILDPKVDFVFKKLFGSENHKEILIAFLNSVFGNKGTEEEIVNISIENSEINKNWEGDKLSRLDIKATTSNDNRVNEVTKILEERIEELKEAAERLEVLSHDEETREIYESRQKAIHDQITNLQETAREAKEEGKEKGKKEEKIKIAKKMLKEGESIEKIKKFTNLSAEEINNLA
jgi:small-conductance mechanosensitive channel